MSVVGMVSPARLRRLLGADAKNVSRDPTMLFVIALALLTPVAFAVWRTPIDDFVASKTGLANFTRYAALFIITLPAFLVGWVTGFLFLEDRDEATLLAVDVTPLGKSGFFAYRIAVTAIISLAIAYMAIALLLPDAGSPLTLLASVLIAVEAACVAFILPALARNKVEGLALSKLINIAVIPPVLVYIGSPLRLLAGIAPTYWLGELLGAPSVTYLSFMVVVAAAILVHLAALILSYRLSTKRIG